AQEGESQKKLTFAMGRIQNRLQVGNPGKMALSRHSLRFTPNAAKRINRSYAIFVACPQPLLKV
ncbi:MAG: hypothetical protein P8Y71_09560, partial [Pseudolabrys sp.]